MRIPTDVSLATYILRLIRDDRLEVFYQTDDWKDLRIDVLEEFNYECQSCLKLGKYTRAVCVHHVNHVRKRPDLALSRYYIDKHGKKQRQLVPLCNTCHNIEHPEKFLGEKYKEKFTNEERW